MRRVIEVDALPRRTLLRAIAAAALLASARWRPTVARHRTSERRLAALGSRLAVARPRLARALLRHAEGGPGRGITSVRRRLLDAATVRRETMRGDLVVVDGWHLARSEAALCVYLAARVRDRIG